MIGKSLGTLIAFSRNTDRLHTNSQMWLPLRRYVMTACKARYRRKTGAGTWQGGVASRRWETAGARFSKQLQDENGRLEKLVAELTLGKSTSRVVDEEVLRK